MQRKKKKKNDPLNGLAGHLCHVTIDHPPQYSPSVAPHPDPSPPLLGTARCSAGGRPCVFPGWRAVALVVVMSVFNHFSQQQNKLVTRSL